MKKSIAIVAGVALLAGGYVAGSFIGSPNVDNSKLHGDVSKVNVFNNADDPEVQAAMEQLANDTTLQKQTAVAALLVSDRLYQIDSLVAATEKATAGIAELKQTNEALAKFAKRTGNACSAYELYVGEAAKVMDGEKSDIYEQASNNALAAYSVVENNLEGAKALVSTLTDYLSKNKNEELAKLATCWMQYCAEDAVLNGSKEELTYWNDAYTAVKDNAQLGLDFLVDSRLDLFSDKKVFAKTAVVDMLASRLDYSRLDALVVLSELNTLMGRQVDAMMGGRIQEGSLGSVVSIYPATLLDARQNGMPSNIFLMMRQTAFGAFASYNALSAFTIKP